MVPALTQVRLTAAGFESVKSGLLGWISCQYGDLQLDGITLRVTETGRYTLSFPARKDRMGREHALVRPVDADARQVIEEAIMGALGIRPEVAP